MIGLNWRAAREVRALRVCHIISYLSQLSISCRLLAGCHSSQWTAAAAELASSSSSSITSSSIHLAGSSSRHTTQHRTEASTCRAAATAGWAHRRARRPSCPFSPRGLRTPSLSRPRPARRLARLLPRRMQDNHRHHGSMAISSKRVLATASRLRETASRPCPTTTRPTPICRKTPHTRLHLASSKRAAAEMPVLSTTVAIMGMELRLHR